MKMGYGSVLASPDARCRAVVESFLQNVVILDDLIVLSKKVEEEPNEVPDIELVSPNYPERLAVGDSGISQERPGVPLNADTVMNAFADLGMTCAVLNATPGGDFPARTAKVAGRADIVVLDWKIAESVGDATLDVMKKILSDDHNTHRLRLIAIYTGEPNLSDITDRVQSALRESHGSSQPLVIDCCRISKGPIRIVVLAKDGTLSEHLANFGYEQVAEEDLAGRLVDEFESMTSGLLRNVSLAGIAAIRAQAYRILTRFDDTLDAAYLGHRILLPHPPEAEDHLVDALGSELLSILEESRPGVYAGIEAIERWLNRADGPDLSQPFKFPSNVDPTAGWLNLLRRGIEAKEVQLPEGGKSKLKALATQPFAADDDAGRHADHQFAALLKLKARYPGRPPRLSVGSILRTECKGKRIFLLCLQPKCDSTRLVSVSRFPFLPLEVVQDDESRVVHLLVVDTEDDEWVKLGVALRPLELIVCAFKPGANPPGEVLATEDEPGVFDFMDVEKRKYRWLAELKDDHSYKIAAEVASTLARPGPNDAEWLRRASRS